MHEITVVPEEFQVSPYTPNMVVHDSPYLIWVLVHFELDASDTCAYLKGSS